MQWPPQVPYRTKKCTIFCFWHIPSPSSLPHHPPTLPRDTHTHTHTHTQRAASLWLHEFQHNKDCKYLHTTHTPILVHLWAESSIFYTCCVCMTEQVSNLQLFTTLCTFPHFLRFLSVFVVQARINEQEFAIVYPLTQFCGCIKQVLAECAWFSKFWVSLTL